MADTAPDKAELARRFAAETDAIALRGAVPDCAERLEAFHAWFDAECARMQEMDAALAADLAQAAETAGR